MHYPSLEDFIASRRRHPFKGPIAMVLAEDACELASTVAHCAARGFAEVLVLAAPGTGGLEALPETAVRIDHPSGRRDANVAAVNKMIEAAPGCWLHYCFNAEYLFHPFAESRTVGEMLAFHTEERRDAMLTYVVDLYAADLSAAPDGVSRQDALLDRTGYYAGSRRGPDGHILERQLDFFGGLRWRFEEHIAPERRRIDRIALFRAQPGLRLGEDHLFNIPEYNTFACPWHNNITAALCSFRAAKALRANAGSRFDIDSFRWHNSVPFEWTSRQLLELGLMEPGQWF